MNGLMLMKEMLRDLPNAAYTCDEMGFIKAYNKAAVELWGREPVSGQDRWDGGWKTFNSDGSSLEPGECPMAKTLLQQKPVFGKELIVQRPDNSFRYVITYPAPLYNATGKFFGGINILIDVTEKKQSSKSESGLYRDIVEHAADGIFVFDRQGNFLSANASGCKMLGYTLDELTLLNITDIMPVAYTGKLPVATDKLFRGEPILAERQFVKSEGTLFFGEISATLTGNGNIQAIVRDITQRRTAEQQLQKRVERHEILTEATADTIWDWDVVNNKMFYNEGITKMLGYQVAEIKNLTNWWKKNIHPDDFERVCKTVDEVFSSRKKNSHLTYRFKCADDSYKFIYDRWLTIFDKYGRPERMVGVMQDVTKYKEEDVRITKAIIETQESERRIIGAELHDNVNQILTGCLLNLAMIKTATPEKVCELAETSREYLLTAISELRKLTHRLVPVTESNTSSPVELFENLVSSMNTNRQFTVHTDFRELNNNHIDDDTALALYRMLQEQLTNIVKYSKATAVDISIAVSKNDIVMRIYDNGQGFDAHLVKMGIGLNNIKKRIRLLDGVFTLNTSEGNGCEIIAQVPVSKQVVAA